MPENDPTIPQCVIEADAAEAYLKLEPPATPTEIDELEWYSEHHGKNGVLATLGEFTLQRTSVLDPTYALISSAFHPNSIIFTDEELAEIGTSTDEKWIQYRADRQRELDESRERSKSWYPLRIHNPTHAYDRIDKVRAEQGDKAADELYVTLFGPKLSDEEHRAIIEQGLEHSRILAADRQREWQKLDPEEQRQRTARVRMLLFGKSFDVDAFYRTDVPQ